MPLDYSQISLYGRCPRKFYYVYRRALVEKMHPAAVWSKHLIHRSFSGWWLRGGQHSPDWDVLYNEFLHDMDGVSDSYYTLDMAQIAFEKYTKQFANDFLEYDVITSEETRPVVEVADFVTKPDLVLRRKLDDKVFVKDFKASKYEKHLLAFDRQLLGQVLGYKAHGFSIDAIKVSKTKARGIEIDIMRDEQEVSTDLLSEWTEETNHTIDAIGSSDLMNIWPKHAPDACYAFSPCPFIDICAAGALREESIERAPKKEDIYDYLMD